MATTISQTGAQVGVCLSILTPPKRTVWRKGGFNVRLYVLVDLIGQFAVGVNTSMRTGCMAGEVLDVA